MRDLFVRSLRNRVRPLNTLWMRAAIVVGGPGNPMRLLDVIECFICQHGLRHMGEDEHGRALVGLGGMTG